MSKLVGCDLSLVLGCAIVFEDDNGSPGVGSLGGTAVLAQANLHCCKPGSEQSHWVSSASHMPQMPMSSSPGGGALSSGRRS